MALLFDRLNKIKTKKSLSPKSIKSPEEFSSDGRSPKELSPRKPEQDADEEGSRKITSCGNASMTLEASLALTVFLLFAVSVCQLFLIMQMQISLQKSLEQVTGEAASFSYVTNQITLWDTDSVLLDKIEDYLLTDLSTEALRLRLISAAGEDYLDNSLVLGGAGGLSLAGSSILEDGHWIRLALSYKVSLPVSVLGINAVSCTQRSSRYAWLGNTDPSSSVSCSEQMVYVTASGEVYHLCLDCRYLNVSVQAVNYSELDALRNSSGGKYYPCERCDPAEDSGTVYITPSGTRYHADRDCSALTRSVSAVPISQVGDRRPCSLCGGL